MYSFQTIVPNMTIDEEKFSELFNVLYTYMCCGRQIRLSHHIYSICYYLDNLIMHASNPSIVHRNLKDYNVHMEYILAREQQICAMLYGKADCVLYDSDKASYYLYDVPFPLERQTNAPPPDEPIQPLVIEFKETALRLANVNARIVSALSYYSNRLAQNMSRIKRDIFKYELVRNGKLSGTPLDIIVDNLYLDYRKIQDEMMSILRIKKEFHCDNVFNDEPYTQECHCRAILGDMNRKMLTCHPYNLPASVIEECRFKPELWEKLCTTRSPLTGKPYKCPGSCR